jgi:hypothetical protein
MHETLRFTWQGMAARRLSILEMNNSMRDASRGTIECVKGLPFVELWVWGCIPQWMSCVLQLAGRGVKSESLLLFSKVGDLIVASKCIVSRK